MRTVVNDKECHNCCSRDRFLTEIAMVIIQKSVHRATKILDILYTLHSADTNQNRGPIETVSEKVDQSYFFRTAVPVQVCRVAAPPWAGDRATGSRWETSGSPLDCPPCPVCRPPHHEWQPLCCPSLRPTLQTHSPARFVMRTSHR